MVVSRLFAEAIGFSPLFISRKHPVPYVFFTDPGSTHICPNRAACWSPAIPAMGTLCAKIVVLVAPYTSLDDFTAGIIEAGISNSSSSSSSHCRVWMLKSIVRDALLTSVTCTSPRVSRQISHVSTVPNISLPFSARSRAPATLSRIHFIFVALK